jgi:hypothetical protein
MPFPDYLDTVQQVLLRALHEAGAELRSFRKEKKGLPPSRVNPANSPPRNRAPL